MAAVPAMACVSDRDFYQALFDTLPLPIFVLNADLTIRDLNDAAACLPEDVLLDAIRPNWRGEKIGRLLRCAHSDDCGGPACQDCDLVTGASNAVGRIFQIARRDPVQIERYRMSLTPFEIQGESLLLLTLDKPD